MSREPLHFDKVRHEYRLGATPVPSVTRVLRRLVEMSLGKLDTPEMERARIRGQHVHAACQFEDEGDLDITSIGAYAGYVEAWRKFKRENKVDIVLNEHPVAHRGMRYAGTLDRVLWMRDSLWLGDIKTGGHIPAHDIQTAAYVMALVDEGLGCGAYAPTVGMRRATILLDADGNYQFVESKNSMHDDFSVFLAELRIHYWREQHWPTKP